MIDPKVTAFSKSGKSCLLFVSETSEGKVYTLLYDLEIYAITTETKKAIDLFIEMEDKED